MKLKTSIIFLVVIIVVILVILGVSGKFSALSSEPTPVACTMEAKLCPDGSYVGRTGPKCEFSVCPDSQATTTGGNGILTPNSGVRGVVMLGPTCPVMRDPPDPQCADRPYETMITVFRKADPVRAYAFAKSAANGTFSFRLPPGNYILGAGEKMMPWCNNVEVSVASNTFTQTTIDCDTGIR